MKIIATALLLGCGETQLSAGELDTGSGPIVPLSGWYQTISTSEPTWDCGWTDAEVEPARESGLVRIDTATGVVDRFSWRWADESDDVTCVLDSSDFSCLVYSTTSPYTSPAGGEATLRDSLSVRGAWSNDHHGEGEFVRSYSCEGAACVEYAHTFGDAFSFPCLGSTSFSTEFVES